MKKVLNRINKNDRGQGMIEYVLILLLVVGAVLFLRDRLSGWSETAAGKVEGQLDQF